MQNTAKAFRLLAALSVSGILTLLTPQIGSAQQKTILVRGDHNYPPYEYLNSKGQPEGFNVDVIRAVAKVMGLDIKISLGQWDEVRGQLERGEIDVLMAMFNTKERDKKLDFSIPHFMASYAVFVREDSSIQSIGDVKNKKIIVHSGGVGHDYVKENNLGSQIITKGDWEETLQALSQGVGDCAIVARVHGINQINKSKLNNVKAVGPPIIQRKYAIAVKEGDSSLLAKLNEGLFIIKTSGVFKEIYDKWFAGIDIEPLSFNNTLKYLGWIVLPLLSLVLVGFLWSWSLRKKVSKKTIELCEQLSERKQAEKALQKSEERFKLAMHATKDGMWDWNVETDKTYFSPGYYLMLGYEPNGFPMTGQEWMDRLHPLDRENALKANYDCIDNKSDSFEVEFRMKTKSEGWNWILCRGNAVDRDGDGKARRLVGTHIDISERKQTEEEKRRLQLQLVRAEKMETVGTLAGGVAHDLNNILGAIVGYPDLMLQEAPKGGALEASILAIKDSGEKATSIVQDLLTMARRGIAITEVCNLNSIIDRYLGSQEFLKLKEIYHDVQVETNLAMDLLNLLGSPFHLSKVVMNLVHNAAEAMPKGGVVLISTENTYLDKPLKGYDRIQEGDYVVLTVTDTGVGIPQSDLGRIFEPFYTKKVMGRSGTGLGMAVVWGTIKDHKGYIDVESKESKGSSFKVYFPVIRKEVDTDKGVVPISEYHGKGEKILVIDDVEAQRQIALKMLTELNYEVSVVSSGEEAIEYLKNNSADLLVLDMIMDPGIDGLETYKEIIKNKNSQKAIIASGFSETDNVREAQSLGAGAYLKKPYTIEKIGMAVKAELEKPVK